MPATTEARISNKFGPTSRLGLGVGSCGKASKIVVTATEATRKGHYVRVGRCMNTPLLPRDLEDKFTICYKCECYTKADKKGFGWSYSSDGSVALVAPWASKRGQIGAHPQRKRMDCCRLVSVCWQSSCPTCSKHIYIHILTYTDIYIRMRIYLQSRSGPK